MTGSGRVKNGNFHAIMKNIHYFAHQISCVQGDGLSRFDINLNMVGVFKTVQRAYKQLDIIVGTGYMMPPSDVEPFHLIEVFAEFFFDCFQRRHKCVRVLLTKCMKMQSADSLELVLPELIQRDSETGSGRTWIVHAVFLRGTFRIDTYAAFF